MATTSITPVSRAAAWFGRFEAWLERICERVNPILVKECRQSLKSRHFSYTFALVLICCWLWSIWGLTMAGQAARFGAGHLGQEMFFGYLAILAFAMLIIVPHGAFRSLADERDDRTFELLAITTLGPRQIVGGKLGSAFVQMLVFMSAVAPCLAFTYLLRGIEAPTILIWLGYTFLASLGLSLLAILAGTLAAERPWQTLWSAAVVIALALVFYFFLRTIGELTDRERMPYDEPEFWFANGALLIFYWSYFALFYLAAAARLTFASENRSTALRIVMFVQQLLLTFCVVWITAANVVSGRSANYELVYVLEGALPLYLGFSTAHWYVMGVFMTGERSQLSARAKRRLPQSFLGRALFTWFNPGSASGYLFAVANLSVAVILAFGTAMYCRIAMIRTGGWPRSMLDAFPYVTVLLFAYVTLYLGLGRLMIGLLRRVASIGIILAVLLQVLMVLAGVIMPRVIEEAANMRHTDYSLLYVFDPFMTLSSVNRLLTSDWITPVMTIVLTSAVAVFVANLPAAAEEIRQVRVAKPPRVAEDDAQLAKPARRKPRNPWEEEMMNDE